MTGTDALYILIVIVDFPSWTNLKAMSYSSIVRDAFPAKFAWLRRRKTSVANGDWISFSGRKLRPPRNRNDFLTAMRQPPGRFLLKPRQHLFVHVASQVHLLIADFAVPKCRASHHFFGFRAKEVDGSPGIELEGDRDTECRVRSGIILKRLLHEVGVRHDDTP